MYGEQGPAECLSKSDLEAVFDQSRDLIVMLDHNGTIVLANEAWRRGAERRGASGATTGCGVNYLDVCERSDAGLVAAGVRDVLRSVRQRFEFDYPCPSPTGDSWWALEVVAFGTPGGGAVLTHIDVTAQTAAQLACTRGSGVEPVTMLPTTQAGVPQLAQLLAGPQARHRALAVVTMTLTNLADIESSHGRRCRDDLTVQVAARVLRFTRPDDAMIRPSTNILILFASVADARGGEFLRDQIAEAVNAPYLVGPADLVCHVEVRVRSSGQFATIASLADDYADEPARQPTDLLSTADDVAGCEPDYCGPDVPLMVYSLPDGRLQAANQAARSLFSMEGLGRARLRARDVIGPIDAWHTELALSALHAGATDSYRAQRTLATANGPVALLTSVRHLVVRSASLAVALTVPADTAHTATPPADDPFAAALIAGTIDGNGVICSVSSPASPMETELAAALNGTLRNATHPSDVEVIDGMARTVRLRSIATGSFRLPHADQGWVVCQCQLFTVKDDAKQTQLTSSPVSENDAFVFVLYAHVNTKAMVDRIAGLERHLRQIGSEVHAADVQMTVRPTEARGVSAVLDGLQLTARQRDIVERLAQGHRVATIATALFISRSTVRNHLAHVYQLVGVHSQEALLNALRMNRPDVRRHSTDLELS